MINYDSLLSDQVKRMQPSGIRKFFDVAAMMEGVISLGVGEPDFQTPWVVRKEAVDILERKRIIYSANSGMMNLRKEIANYLNRKYDLTYDSNSEVIATVGGSEAIDLAIRAIVNPGDEVLVVEPSFVCYKPIVELMHGVAVPIPTKEENKFKLTPEELQAHITEKTKMLILPYPNNPTGGIMTREDLEKIAAVLRGTNILVLSDEIYSELTYGTKHCSIASIPDMWERTIYVSGFSKAFAMTGWRLGYLIGPAEVIEHAKKVHDFLTVGAPAPLQEAACVGVRFPQSYYKELTALYTRKRDVFLKGLDRLGLKHNVPQGTYFVLLDISDFLALDRFQGWSDLEFCEWMIREIGVAAVPGSSFFREPVNHLIRLHFARSEETLEQALDRLAKLAALLH